MAPTKDKLAEVKGTWPLYVSWVTRRATSVQDQVNVLERDPSKVAVNAVAERLNELDSQFNKVEGMFFDVLVWDNENYAKNKETLDKASDTRNKAHRVAGEAIRRAEEAILPRRDPSLREIAGKVDVSLKPDVLAKNTNQLDFKLWANKFRSYHEANKMFEMSNISQQGHFKNVLDTYLTVAVEGKIKPDWPIYNPVNPEQSCMHVLEQEFLQLEPLFTRRCSYFGMEKCPSGSDFTQWAQKVVMLGESADVKSMKPEDHTMQVLLRTCSDSKLKLKLMELL